MNYDQLSIEQLAALRDEVNAALAERVSARQRELSGESERLSALVTQTSGKSHPQPRAKRPIKYRDGQNEWSGCGTMPAWAKLKGDTLESYRV
jgi:DNA-binding protein H-NS